MEMRRKPAIIFDLGGVLIDWNPHYLYRKMFADETLIQDFIEETGLLKWNEKQDAGRPFSDAVKILSADYPHYEQYIRAFHERWVEMVGGALDQTVEILAELRVNNYELYALSNWSAETYPLARERFEFLGWFREVVISGEQKMIKPDVRIFEFLLNKIMRPAEECIYIDDSKPNFEAAQRLGFQAIHFQSADKLRAELEAMNILSIDSKIH